MQYFFVNKHFENKKNIFFNDFFETYILSEVLKNEFLWQSDHGLCHQTTVYRSRKFAKNQENTYVLGHTPMGAIIYRILFKNFQKRYIYWSENVRTCTKILSVTLNKQVIFQKMHVYWIQSTRLLKRITKRILQKK